MSNEETTVSVEKRNGVAIIMLQRSARRNSMDRPLVDGVKAALLELDRNDDVGAVVLAGTAPGFCAGSDLKFIGRLELEAMGRFEQECGDLGRLIGYLAKPVVAAVEKFAIGGGLTLATSCDVVVAGRSSVFSLPEVPHGWLTPWGIRSLVARVGLVKARLLCFCLEALNSEDARAIGIVDYCCEDGEALTRAIAIAEKLAQLPRPAVRATKRFFSNYLMEDAEAMDFEANRLFLENCRETPAQATLDKFRQR
ncbi:MULTISPECIES: enoyl-CoA hydratase/isomerase family protein [Bradyrhizobium]|uniref:Enoyl-CoA hydratase/carnithine racemase n=1 Tax=Bradyrhizobium elkanii TaxID=29448 RepID=A0A1E3ERF0_BRAEL|nr:MULTISPECIES: enoyl-CoA hydratase/isomerase family protein [Bradyrhizobium]MBP1294519.1 enoyl-CoA hydratase/carnithine racemase [Bradyrhizobium elkanii]MCP1925098.1 enoyl-CoA hydratase/carnithine racemase [Bradyrhizobium elkanii]MCS3477413.1 enoyl-CoA hydratase/carnithine racemase [Bradyrhizobium elkanii]MCS3584148.1 enoyl-CoA hydratase/carnithine racemase [Bradyrhizobium elkanii]MCS3717728.1 enoyl-CoA hydratase/carnithine racemase [Bradyrhizobium elkanii]